MPMELVNQAGTPSRCADARWAASTSERDEAGIDSLPGSMGAAIACTESSRLVREALGDHIFEKFIANKKIEWDQYRSQVTGWELEKYLPVL